MSTELIKVVLFWILFGAVAVIATASIVACIQSVVKKNNNGLSFSLKILLGSFVILGLLTLAVSTGFFK